MIKNCFLQIFAVISLFACVSNKESVKTSMRLEAYLDSLSKNFRFNGNVLVAENGKIVFQKSFGFANFETKHLLNDSSVFELASISKQFTATAILLLMNSNRLKLSDSLKQYFPELSYRGITIYHMLTHTSGLPDYEEAMKTKWDKSKIAFNSDVITFLAKTKMPLLFAPGTKWEYSNTAYVILASIVEKVSGQSFKDFMTQHIFQPLQMNHTQIYNTRRSLKDTIHNYAYGYEYNNSLKKYFMPDSVTDLKFVIYLDGIQGDGVVNSTTGDLLKWDRSIKNNTLLGKATQNEMLKEQVLADTLSKSHYGFGVFIEKTDLGDIISHSGEWPGYCTYLLRNVKKDQTIIVLSNNDSDSEAVALALHQLLNGKSVVGNYEYN
jgi:CubicO group peptidase (beta-lactamase class C family)